MKHYSTTVQGFTTLVLAIEDNISADILSAIRSELQSISTNKQISYEGPNSIINKSDEDIRIGWKFVVVSNQSDSCIESVITDIAEML
jgi:hypothetical protein